MSNQNMITIHWPNGSAPYTDRVEAANISTHIAAGDDRASEARILQECMNDLENNPVAWKYADPIEDGKLIYDEDDAWEIINEDPSLIVWIEFIV